MMMNKTRLSALVTIAGIALCTAASSAQHNKQMEHKANALTPAEVAAGWTLLFDGSSTDDWRGYRKDGFPQQGWVIDDGAIKVIAGGGGGDIITKDKYGDFELSLEFKVSERANSGIMYRVTEEHGAPWQTGPEFQILDDAAHNMKPTNMHSTGALYDLYAPSETKTLKKAGEFNHVRIVSRRDRITHYLNGEEVLSFDASSDDYLSRIANSKFSGYDGFGVRTEGHICLQDHGNDVWFRNIKIRDLDGTMPGEVSLFNGRDMTGWQAFLPNGGTKDDVWSVTDDGVMICKGRPIGYIYTDDKYDNFVIKLEWRFDPAKGAGNSGVLVRMVGEHKVWPKSVEAQLHSGSAGDFWNIGNFAMKTDESRTNGRNTKKTHRNELPLGQWNEYEIICDGGHIVLNVNGETLNHAWDVEEVAGPILLQSEGAEIHFRNIRLAPIQ